MCISIRPIYPKPIPWCFQRRFVKQAKTQTVVFNFYCSNRIFIGLARMPFFRLRILVGFSERIFEYSFQKKTPSKTTLIIPIYSLEPILTVSAYFVEDLIAFERYLVGLSKLELLRFSLWKRTAVVPYQISCPLPSQPLVSLIVCLPRSGNVT